MAGAWVAGSQEQLLLRNLQTTKFGLRRQTQLDRSARKILVWRNREDTGYFVQGGVGKMYQVIVSGPGCTWLREWSTDCSSFRLQSTILTAEHPCLEVDKVSAANCFLFPSSYPPRAQLRNSRVKSCKHGRKAGCVKVRSLSPRADQG